MWLCKRTRFLSFSLELKIMKFYYNHNNISNISRENILG